MKITCVADYEICLLNVFCYGIFETESCQLETRATLGSRDVRTMADLEN